jgi:hypothetical protein
MEGLSPPQFPECQQILIGERSADLDILYILIIDYQYYL